jgi:hypothetical protein
MLLLNRRHVVGGTVHRYSIGTDGKPRRKQLGRMREVLTRAAAERAAEPIRGIYSKPAAPEIPTVGELVEQFREEKMSEPHSTRRAW